MTHQPVAALAFGGVILRGQSPVRNIAVLLLVSALTGTPAAVLTCEWLCASHAPSPSAHCHGSDSSSSQVGGHHTGCNHEGLVTQAAVVKTTASGLGVVTSPANLPALTASAGVPTGFVHRHVDGPPGPPSRLLHRSLSALRI